LHCELDAFTDGAIATGATVTGSAEIADYIDQRTTAFDLDGNGSRDALTDGLLLMRYLFGLSGDVMTSGVVGVGATGNSYAEITSFIAGAAVAEPTSEPLRFVYQAKCKLDIQGNEICCSQDAAGFKDFEVGEQVTPGGKSEKITVSSSASSYGTIKVQSLISGLMVKCSRMLMEVKAFQSIAIMVFSRIVFPMESITIR